MEIMEGATKFHVCLSIEGTLRQSDKQVDGLLSKDGAPLPGKLVKHELYNIRAKHGYSYYSGCDNMDEDGRCKGHPVETKEQKEG